jgi:dTDP-4-dehydrorhamnose reductase
MRILLTGAGGQLGQDLVAAFQHQNEARQTGKRSDILALSREQLDVSSRDRVYSVCHDYEPDVIIHPAAWTKVDECESNPEKAYAINACGTKYFSDMAKTLGAYMLYVSTDYVFDGRKPSPYVEWDTPNPLSVYGKSKLAGEQAMASVPFHAIIRTSWVAGYGGANMVKTVMKLLAERESLQFVEDQIGSPTFTADLADKILEITSARLTGTFHVTNSGVTSWYEFASEIATLLGYGKEKVLPVKTADLFPPRPAPRPENSVLDNMALRIEGLRLLPDWRESLAGLVHRLRD